MSVQEVRAACVHRPRRTDPGSCQKCGFPIPADPLPDERVNEFFDRFRDALQAAGKLGPAEDPMFDWFRLTCIQRLRKGAETYGNRNFLRPEVDPILEALEEFMDAPNYLLMEMVKNEPDDTDAALLGEAVAFSFYAAQALLRYKEKVRGVSG